MKLNGYLSIYKNSWQYHIAYRLNTILGFLIAMISLISIFYLWNNIFETKALLAGYSKEQIVTYYILVGYLMASIYVFFPISQEIRDGTLSIFLTKPINYFFYHYWSIMAQRVTQLILGLPIILLIFFIFREHVFIVFDIKAYLILFITAIGAINILFVFDILVGIMEFWIMYADNSIKLITDSIVNFFAGTLIPLIFLPSIIQQIGNFLPFKYTGYFMIDAFLGRLNGVEIIFGIGMQIFWTLVLLFVVKLVWYRGLKKYEAVGA